MAQTTQSCERELQVAVRLAREAGAAILEFYRKPLEIEQKESFSNSEPVTEADRVANDLIVTSLQREFPDDGILAEESIDTAHRLDRITRLDDRSARRHHRLYRWQWRLRRPDWSRGKWAKRFSVLSINR